MAKSDPLIVGVSGASGAPVAVDVLQTLKAVGVPVHLVISRGGEMTLRQECQCSPEALKPFCERLCDNENIGEMMASGSASTRGMLIVPCSMKTLAGIACGYSDSLLLRAADVTLKERRPLVLCCRESPLSLIHLRNMQAVTEAGAIVVPPMLEYYTNPQSIQDMTHHVTGKLLAMFHIDVPDSRHWEGMT